MTAGDSGDTDRIPLLATESSMDCSLGPEPTPRRPTTSPPARSPAPHSASSDYANHYANGNAKPCTALNGSVHEAAAQRTDLNIGERLRRGLPGPLNPRVQGSSPWGRTTTTLDYPQIES